MPTKRGDIQKILDRDNLKEQLDMMLEVNPEDVVLAYHSAETGKAYRYWFGSWPAAVGLARLIGREIEKWDDDEEAD